MKKVIIELTESTADFTMEAASKSKVAKFEGFTMDMEYEPVSIGSAEDMDAGMEVGTKETVLIRGEIDEEKVTEIEALPNVVKVWDDGRIDAFGNCSCQPEDAKGVEDIEALGLELPDSYLMEPEEDDGELASFDLALATPCPPTDCQPTVAKGTIADVAKYLRCDRLWAKGIRGAGVVIGIVDSGVNKTKVPAVIGGWSPTASYTPGTAPASSHGTMTAFDAAGMAPDAKIYDIALLQAGGGISGLLSDAIKAYQWALDQYNANKTPQILSNSWGMYQKAWAPNYATNPNHPVTRKILQVINRGIIVTFAAGNCGSQCPSGKCASDTGPGKSIWGANGHPKVITVGAANIREEWIGYTSQGPAALDPKKPDFCAPSHFKGATNSDNGTSAACPIAAGVIALYRSHDPNLRQDRVKEALQETAKNLCSSGWDPHSGHGMIQGEAAFNKLNFFSAPLTQAMWVHGTSVQEEYPNRLLNVRKMGPYGLFYGKPNTRNWFHYALPTPVIVDSRRLRLDSVMLMFLTSRDTWVTNVHIYDGNQKIESFDGLAMTGAHWFERFDILNRWVRYGIGLSIGVKFGSQNLTHYVAHVSAGGDFMK